MKLKISATILIHVALSKSTANHILYIVVERHAFVVLNVLG